MYTSITVRQVLRSKGQGFHAIGPEATAYDALEIMAEKNIGAMLVVESGKLIGVFSERDYARKVILRGKSSKGTTVRELMSSPPITVGMDASMRDCMVLMTEKRIRHLPVMEKDVLWGIVSIGDVVNTIIREQEKAINDLEDYIAGNEYTREAVSS
ncbi:MAG: CBS domain-containing protein [Nitrospirota bacterium]|jgi:CBS domain-containing protein